MSNSQKALDTPIEHEREIQNHNNLFNLKPAGQWLEDAGKTPQPKALFGDFWLEGELSILFSDTGRGKSTLAVQIAEALARGMPVAPMESAPEAQKVLYLDFELSEKQFEARYSDGERAKLMIVAKRLYAQGATQRRVAMIMGINHSTVCRYLKASTPGDENILKEDDIHRMQEENV